MKHKLISKDQTLKTARIVTLNIN